MNNTFIDSSTTDEYSAIIQGQPVDQLPVDLYIPPEALRVFLEIFEGPLDFLSYLIRKQNLDILNINVARIAKQYSSYVHMMQQVHFELAADYLAMAAWLTELKSRFLLPRPKNDTEDEDIDPRAELIKRIMEYEQIRAGAETIDEMPRINRDLFLSSVVPIQQDNQTKILPDIHRDELIAAISNVLKRASLYQSHQIKAEPLSIRERMTNILEKINNLSKNTDYISMDKLFSIEEGIPGVVVTLLALLELLKSSCLELVQGSSYGSIYIKPMNDHVN